MRISFTNPKCRDVSTEKTGDFVSIPPRISL